MPTGVYKRIKKGGMSGKKHSVQTREKISLAGKGRKHTDEWKKKMKGKIPWNKGIIMPIEKRKENHRKNSLKWSNNNRKDRIEQARRSSLKIKYGMTIDDYENMFSAQDGKCAICNEIGNEWVDSTGRKRPALLVDHCHETNKVRGLLCHNCNIGIGNLRHSLEILENAKKYLINNQ